MELKDVILSTLAELEESVQQSSIAPVYEPNIFHTPLVSEEVFESHTLSATPFFSNVAPSLPTNTHEDEERLLEGIRERLLVLFEGFQSPNNVQIEAKVDLTLNFLEYLLATIDNRLESFNKK